MSLRERYGPWALVVGGSQGIGAAFATRLAREGMNVALVARSAGALSATASLLEKSGLETRVCSIDLAEANSPERIAALARSTGARLVVYNAALALPGSFGELDPEQLERLIQTNVRSPIMVARHLVGEWTGNPSVLRAGVVLLSSMAGNCGSPLLAPYAASKAFLRVLGEGLWDELRDERIDVTVAVAGATDTPGYRRQVGLDDNARRPLGVLPPDRVAQSALRALGRRPVVIPGSFYKISALILNRLVPRRSAIRIMGAAGRRVASRTRGG